MTIGERIKKRREELGISVDELAGKLGKNRATIYRYESSDIVKLPTTVLEPLANALKTTPAYLMGWEEWDKEAQRFEDDFNDRENKMISLLSAYLTDPKEIDTAVEIIRQFPRLNSEGLKKLLDRVDELVKLGYLSDIEKELMNM